MLDDHSPERALFSGFDTSVVDVGESTIFLRRQGRGSPLLLLHGFPQTHLMWHRVAPALAQEFTVVCADLRGSGSSGKPPSAPDHRPYSKGTMALDMVRVMEAQGFARFFLAGHDRGARVAYRMAMDHPERIERLALLDIIPTSDALRRADVRFALAFWPWSLLAQPEPLPERLILGDPEIVVDHALREWGSDPASFSPRIRAAYVEALRDPEAVHAICEEYRAAATIDFARDTADQAAGRRIPCPTLILWSEGSSLARPKRYRSYAPSSARVEREPGRSFRRHGRMGLRTLTTPARGDSGYWGNASPPGTRGE